VQCKACPKLTYHTPVDPPQLAVTDWSSLVQTDKVQVQQTKIKGAEEEAARLAKEKDAAEGLLSKLAAELEG